MLVCEKAIVNSQLEGLLVLTKSRTSTATDNFFAQSICRRIGSLMINMSSYHCHQQLKAGHDSYHWPQLFKECITLSTA